MSMHHRPSPATWCKPSTASERSGCTSWIRRAAFAALVLLGTAPAVDAQELTRFEGLGALSFPNSGASEAQDDFLRGVLLLHSFEYGDAVEAFRRAREIDPDFALAYWGEAMTYARPVWNQKDEVAGRAALARYAATPEARQDKALTARERGYLRAVDVLYGEGPKQRLDTLYAREMEALVEAHPEDPEARAFYALALLGLSQGVRDVPTYVEAGAVALGLLGENPDHPGAAHYVIHAFDDPVHAPLAMEAADVYGRMAPDAAHAQHMTSHIFLARGMWDRVVEANLRADAVADRGLKARSQPPGNCGHYNEWLMYGYQQQGRFEDARALLVRCYADTGNPELSVGRRQAAASSFVFMRSLYLADTEDYDEWVAEAEIDGADIPLARQLTQAWADAFAALQRGDLRTAERRHAWLVEEGGTVERTLMTRYVPVWTGTLEALLALAAGDGEAALEAARDAADEEASLPVDFGPPLAYKPARELEGDILMQLDRSAKAMTAYAIALERTPNRMQSLLGYARAADAAGRPTLARDAYRQLAANVDEADADVRAVAEAEAYLARNSLR